ncbi:MAG: hypothetical protein ABIZ04_21445 [Opitutus sp.]
MDELLGRNNDSNIPNPTAKRGLDKLPSATAQEVEESAQLLAWVSLVCKRLSSPQIIAILNDVIADEVLTQKSKVFWAKILTGWLKTNSELEGWNELSSSEKVSAIRAKNDRKRADPDSKQGAA